MITSSNSMTSPINLNRPVKSDQWRGDPAGANKKGGPAGPPVWFG
jgi:hypothetical protein